MFDVNSHDRGYSIPAAVFFSLLLSIPVSNSRAQSPHLVFNTEPPSLQLDLHSYGYKSHVRGTRDSWSVAFVGNDDLVLGWTTLDDPLGKKIGPLTPTPSHLHALVLSARTGQKQILGEWAVSTLYASIHPVANGEFLVCAGNAVRLLSHDFAMVHELALSRFGPCTGNEVSPSGQSFCVDSGAGKQFQRSVMNTESFTPVATWSNEARGVHFSDTYLAGNCQPNGELCVRKFNDAWARLASYGADRKARVRTFCNDSTLVLVMRGELALVTTEGDLLFHADLEEKHSIGETAISSGSQRLAVVKMRMRGVTNEVLDVYAFPSDDEVTVYSFLERKAIYARKVKGTSPWPPFTEHHNRLAISSDGALLAIFDDGILSVYNLPVPKS